MTKQTNAGVEKEYFISRFELFDLDMLILPSFCSLFVEFRAMVGLLPPFIQFNQGPTLDSEPLEYVTLPLVRSQGCVFGGARPAGLGEAARPGFLLIFGTLAPAIRTHPKLVELIRIKQNMNGT